MPLPALPEAGPLGLAPTTSTLMMLALCDALAMALLDAKGFAEEDFARYHPDGNLGRRLLTRALDLMHSGDQMPVVKTTASFKELLLEMAGKHLGMTCIVDSRGVLRGVFTDGDLRRLMETKKDFSAMKAKDMMHAGPRTIGQDDMATKALQMMEEFSITSVIVSDNGKTIDGIIHLHDLLKAGIA